MFSQKIKQLIMEMRWLLVPLYLGLGVSMVAFVVKFAQLLFHILTKMVSANENELLLEALSLIDIVLVANLLIMVIVSGYETFVSPIKIEVKETPGWLTKLDPGTVKIKLASSVVGISLIRLLTIYMKLENFESEKVLWSVVIHFSFLFSALFLAFVDKLTYEKGGGANENN